MKRKKRTRELCMREWQYFGLNTVVYICTAGFMLMILNAVLRLFQFNMYIKLVFGLIVLMVAAFLTKYIAAHNMVRWFLNQFRVEK